MKVTVHGVPLTLKSTIRVTPLVMIALMIVYRIAQKAFESAQEGDNLMLTALVLAVVLVSIAKGLFYPLGTSVSDASLRSKAHS